MTNFIYSKNEKTFGSHLDSFRSFTGKNDLSLPDYVDGTL